jgi:N-acetylglucosaminyldiphosphoundecaprenol N-acetyl-beta-D-mannosaminyltransferase
VKTVNILGVPIAAVNMHQAATQIEEWIRHDVKTYVTVTGVHGIMESQNDEEVKRVHRAAGFCVPDGMPTVWVGRLYGHWNMRRVYGPDLMLEIMRRSVNKGYAHFFYGGKDGVPELLQNLLIQKFPGLCIVGTMSPPFRPMTEEEEKDLETTIQRLSPDIIWVGLSTPKQERWMADHINRLNTKVMVGVGAAFDFHAGLLRQAPPWMQKIGAEWFFRLCMEPTRLWKRYLKNNPRFIFKFLGQVLSSRKDY